MYLKFFNLKNDPFHITPDPEFLFLSDSHKEALGAIIYGIEKRKGFVSITGEVGTGKTTIIRSALERISKDRVKPIYFFNVHISFSELLNTIFLELGIESQNNDVYGMIQELHRILIKGYRKNYIIVLIIDEAQNMPDETLEKLRMLSNLETKKDKLLQIILVGQPELEKKLKQHKLRQLNQRIAIKARIDPLSFKESLAYINHRLSRVALDKEPLFKSNALKKIASFSLGIPRVLNILCDNSLIAGFGYQKKPVTRKIAEEVIRDYEGKTKQFSANWRFAFISILLSILVIFIFRTDADISKIESFLTFSKENKMDVSKTIITHKIEPDLANEKEKKEKKLPVEHINDTALQNRSSTSKEKHDSDNTQVKLQINKKSLFSELSLNTSQRPYDLKHEPSIKQENLFFPEKVFAVNDKVDIQSNKSSILNFSDDKHQISKDFPLEITVQEGEYLTRLCYEIYGYTNDKLIQHVKAHNPQIEDSDLILIGDKIVFPEPDIKSP